MAHVHANTPFAPLGIAQLDARTRPCNFVAMVLPCASRQAPEPEAARRTVES
ncbi:MAG: hypothetical protein LC652_05250 [Halomonas sp.]|nr:hypothetical protein [Halomonas sp.]